MEVLSCSSCFGDFFIKHGAKATDHGHFTPKNHNLSEEETSKLYMKIYTGNFSQSEAVIFRGQMIKRWQR